MRVVKTFRGARILAGIVFCLAATAAHAQASRTWVSGVGDDANPCSRTAPCKTFAGAISKTAAAGTISVLDPGGFGVVTITKSITIDGGGVEGSILASGTTGIIVNAGATDRVTIRNITINGFLTGLAGIRFIAGADLHVEHCQIYGFRSNSAGYGWGILVNPSTAGERRLYVSDSMIQDNGAVTTGGGIRVAPTGGTVYGTIINTQINNNFGVGVSADNYAYIHLDHSRIAGSQRSGVLVHGVSPAAAEVSVKDSTLEDNGWDTSVSQASLHADGNAGRLAISGNLVTNNDQGMLSTNGGTITTFSDNVFRLNTFNGAATGSAAKL